MLSSIATATISAPPVLCSRRGQSVWRRERTQKHHHLQDQQMYGHHSHDHMSLCAWRGESNRVATPNLCVYPLPQPVGKGPSSTATVSRVDIMRRLLMVNQHFIKCLDLFNTRKSTYVTRVSCVSSYP